MPDLAFQIDHAEAMPNAATPTITFKLRVRNSELGTIHSIALRTQVQIEPVRRRYTSEEQAHLYELFGEPERWSKTLHSLLWANVNTTVTSFTGSTVVDLLAPCTFDFNVAVTKYIYGLENGEIPVTALFSGTMFFAAGTGLQVSQIPWDRSANYRLPVRVWKQMMDQYYPNTAWITLRRDVFERLNEFRARHGMATWDQAIERILGVAAEVNS